MLVAEDYSEHLCFERFDNARDGIDDADQEPGQYDLEWLWQVLDKWLVHGGYV